MKKANVVPARARAGPYAVASVRDVEYIVSVICSSSCPQAALLMKAKELAHNVKVLLGTKQVDQWLLRQRGMCTLI